MVRAVWQHAEGQIQSHPPKWGEPEEVSVSPYSVHLCIQGTLFHSLVLAKLCGTIPKEDAWHEKWICYERAACMYNIKYPQSGCLVYCTDPGMNP